MATISEVEVRISHREYLAEQAAAYEMNQLRYRLYNILEWEYPSECIDDMDIIEFDPPHKGRVTAKVFIDDLETPAVWDMWFNVNKGRCWKRNPVRSYS